MKCRSRGGAARSYNPRVRVRLLLSLALAACTAAEPTAPPPVAVPGAEHLRLEPEPGPPPHEAPPVKTLWRRDGERWLRAGRVLDVAAGGRAWVDAERRLVVDGQVRDGDVLPGLSVGADGTAYYARGALPPETDVWRVGAEGAPVQVTRDGRSDRPFALPDGGLLWISSAPDGVAGWVRDGRKITRGLAVPVPAYPDKTRFEAGRVVYHAGDGWWSLDPMTGEAHAL